MVAAGVASSSMSVTDDGRNGSFATTEYWSFGNDDDLSGDDEEDSSSDSSSDSEYESCASSTSDDSRIRMTLDCMSFELIDGRDAEEAISGSLASCPPTPRAGEEAIEEVVDTLRTVKMLVDVQFSYRGLGLTLPLIEEKRFWMEQSLNLANRADEVAVNARALLNLQCLRALIPLEVCQRVASFFPCPPATRDDSGDRNCDRAIGPPPRMYCVDFSMRESIWPQSWRRSQGLGSKRCARRVQKLETEWRIIHTLTVGAELVR
eukprot:TRINITY_DN29584_c0_g1_i1.p1 TRINITY_DN29584_c0_g1~~TRINITY_DN29584_c0_g1_i1.p1  ORF type:complete len:263 (-),score=43.06 TRINITY_DN29584_c0_g1_i1:229-1017(-)